MDGVVSDMADLGYDRFARQVTLVAGGGSIKEMLYLVQREITYRMPATRAPIPPVSLPYKGGR
jgi:hypothetical protein